MIQMLTVFLLAAGALRPQVGELAPAFEARTLTGSSAHSESLRGQVTVVDFFASWCQPCKEGLREILAIRERLAPPRFALLVVAVEGDTPALRDFLAANSLPAGSIVVLDGDGVLTRAFGEDRLPTTFFLDAKWTIRHINRGHGPGFPERAMRWLSTLYD
jgi:thiol-disulfide isomerase/thioredoxin